MVHTTSKGTCGDTIKRCRIALVNIEDEGSARRMTDWSLLRWVV